MVERLIDLLTEVKSRTSREFSGVGIIVCDAPESLPIVPIRSPNNEWKGRSTVDTLVAVSSISSEFHDGFHILTSDWDVVMVAQYFSPPIVRDLEIDRTKRFGGRYLAALFGSTLPNVTATGIASNGFGVAVFQHGEEVYFKPAP